MRRWSADFTLFAPDSPGFGASDPLRLDDARIEDFADAAVDFVDAIGLRSVGAYGFHSGAITLITAAKRHPGRFAAVVASGYAVWTDAEKATFAENHTPPLVPLPYGEHLAWLWPRVVEQSWFQPWYHAHTDSRRACPSDEPAAAHPIVMDMLQAGDAYRAGYAAALRADRDVPNAGPTPPTLITAHDGDPLQSHLARLGPLPANWRAFALRTPVDVETAARDHLAAHPAHEPPPIADAGDAGFVQVSAGGFVGLLHYVGDRESPAAMLHAPGSAAAASPVGGAMRLDLPGHGLSDDWPTGARPTLAEWAEVVAAALPQRPLKLLAEGWSGLLALAVAERSPHVTAIEVREAHLPRPEDSESWREQALTDIVPDRFGSYLSKAWHATRARHFFWPWFRADAATAIPFEAADIAPVRLRVEHLAAMQARSGQRLLDVLIDADRAALQRRVDVPIAWHRADWAAARADVWTPEDKTQ